VVSLFSCSRLEGFEHCTCVAGSATNTDAARAQSINNGNHAVNHLRVVQKAGHLQGNKFPVECIDIGCDRWTLIVSLPLCVHFGFSENRRAGRTCARAVGIDVVDVEHDGLRIRAADRPGTRGERHTWTARARPGLSHHDETLAVYEFRVLDPTVISFDLETHVEGEGAISQSELVRWALRMSPDRVIVGEIRGPEVVPMCNAMSMGNDGSMATLHASDSRGAFVKLASYAVQGPERLPLEATNLLVATALHFVVHLAEARDDKTRVVSSIREVIDADDKQVISNEVYRPGPDGRAVPGVPLRTETVEQLVEAGFDPDLLNEGGRWDR